MNIALKFDPDLLRRYASNGRSLAFGISFENGGVYYPDDDWIDFGEVILAWWFAAILRLAEGADEDRLPFMEGPYAAGVRYDRESRMVRLSLEGRGVVWHIPFVDLTSALLEAAETMRAEVAKVGHGADDREGLVALENMARRAVSETAYLMSKRKGEACQAARVQPAHGEVEPCVAMHPRYG